MNEHCKSYKPDLLYEQRHLLKNITKQEDNIVHYSLIDAMLRKDTNYISVHVYQNTLINAGQSY